MGESKSARAKEVVADAIEGQPGVIAIPKASNDRDVRDNARSVDIRPTKEDLAEVDQEFPPPKSRKSLPML
jgi:diketogulonate reductase-like aldo/keto reductase